MQRVEDVFEAFGGAARLAEATGLKPFHAQTMKTRKSIPVRHWPKIIDAARERGIDEITYENLVRIHAPEEEGAQ